MKFQRYIPLALAALATLPACDDEIMEWKAKGDVSLSEIPLEVKEVLANYDDIKVYAKQYMPSNIIGIGMGVSLYNANANGEKDLVDANYQMFTCGNAMKMDALMSSSGKLSFTTIDALFDNMPADMKLYGHNFFWHTQQRQAYLKSLIAPAFVMESTSDIKSIIKNGDFETGDKTNWQSWGNESTTEVTEEAAKNDTYGLKMIAPSDGSDYYVSQLVQDLDAALEVGTTYTVRFNARCESGAGSVQFAVQMPKTPYTGEGYHAFDLTNQWATYEYEYTCTMDDMTRFLINFGKVADTYYIDDIEFGIKQEGPTNYCTNGSFEDGLDGWTAVNGADGVSVVDLEDAIDGSKALKMTASDEVKNIWDLQVSSSTMATMPGKKVELSFYVKSDQAGKGRVSFKGLSNNYPWMNWTGKQDSWTEGFETSTTWTHIDVVIQKHNYDFAEDATEWSFNLDFGYEAGVTYYIDNVEVTVVEEEESEGGESENKSAVNKAAKSYYVLKTADEKKEALVGAMEAWVKGVAEHLAEKNVNLYGYDVINEPIADGNNGIRGLNGVFGGSITDDDGNTTYDSEPEESVESGLTLNWGDNHWYWGYYVPDYAVRAFQLARKYLPAETKLFVNDYNLETSPTKLAALIEFVKQIDADNGAAIVDGIGTQMHITLSGTSDNADNNAEKIKACKEQVDAMFKTMAATGKLVRVTELDISLGTSSPSSAQYEAQADCYEMVVKSYKENVPEAQQSGITVWSLSDNEEEHEYWLNGELPNLFDANYLRKWAYKGFCDGIAGEDLGLKFGGNDYKAYYEKNNVSSTVK